MKKILYSVIASGLFLTSCSLSEEPAGQLNIDDAITTTQNAFKFRNGFYTGLRAFSAGRYTAYASIQADEFIGTLSNGNRLGVISLGNIDPGTMDLTASWSSPYSLIMNVNYYLPYLEALINDETIASDDRIELIRYRGEAKWSRAFSYWYLMDHYCEAYTLTDPKKAASGLPLVTEFDPTGEYDKYPGRSTLEETYALIENDLDDAYADLKAYESSLSDASLKDAISPNVAYLNSYVVLALQARVALLKGDYATAITKAEEVIDNPNYSLATLVNYGNLWTSDRGTELLFVPYANSGQQISDVPTTGKFWIDSNVRNADYVASANALAMYNGDDYEADDDVRYEWFFNDRELSVAGSLVYAPAFVKFPGNSQFNTSSTTNDLRNLPKPFRLSETYLILAEAAAESNQPAKANDALNTLRINRIYGYEEKTYQGTTLIEQIRLERTRELIGEGFRISDLRRWNQGFTRSIDYDEDYEDTPGILVAAGCNLSYPAGDHRFIWPIPKSEMEANPQLKGEQNPGY